MATQHVVVDGSNIATEGRSTPSLDQLEGAVAEVRKELPAAETTVVVDATFAHRIDPSELPRYEEAALRGELISPPAGAIGRGDAFLLRIAEKVGAVVLSNDSFQEFHGEHPWLFDRGRLLGATPVPGVGWIFVPRTPVRGPKSRVAVRDSERAKARVEKAIAAATKEVVAPTDKQPRRDSRRPAVAPLQPQAVNDPATFIAFIAEHHLGEQIEADVESFTSHGAVVRFGDVRCYVPLSGLGSPTPRSAREVLHKGEPRHFVVTALDPYRRGVELALPGVAVVSGRPSAETVAAEVRMARAGAGAGPATRQRVAAGSTPAATTERPARSARSAKKASAGSGPPDKTSSGPASPGKASAGKASGKATAAVKASPAKKAAARTTTAAKPSAVPAGSKAAAAKTAAAKTAGTKSAGTKSAGTKSAGSKAAAAKAAGDKAAAKTAATKSAGTKSAGTKSAGTKSAGTKTAAGRTAVTKAAGAKSASTGKRAAGGEKQATKAPAARSVKASQAGNGARPAAAAQAPKTSKAATPGKAMPGKAAADGKAATPAGPRRSPAGLAGRRGTGGR